MHSDVDHTVLPANYTMPTFTPSPPAAEHHRPLAGTHFTVPWRVEGWVDLGGCLHTEIKCRLRESNLDTVTHPSNNRAQRRLTSLTNDIIIRPRRLANSGTRDWRQENDRDAVIKDADLLPLYNIQQKRDCKGCWHKLHFYSATAVQ